MSRILSAQNDPINRADYKLQAKKTDQEISIDGVLDEDFIYMGIICHDPTPGKRPAESYRRDWNFGKNDNFFAAIDTYNDQTNGFAFGGL